MKISPIFTLRDVYTQGILDLLEDTILGTNGAKYRHLDTAERIKEADNPLFVSIERNGKTLGNITFCRRGEHWYIRYFAFKSFLQASSKSKTNDTGNSFLKKELNQFFEQAFEGDGLEFPVKSMYAFIDPQNERSKWMSQNFGFETIAQLSTQSFSRLYPKKSHRFSKEYDWNELKEIAQTSYGRFNYFFETHHSKPPFYVLRNDKNEIIACAHVLKVRWEIVRLPGKWGGVLTKTIPHIPFLSRLIRPKNHVFLVPDIVWSRANDSSLLTELFESMLADSKLNLILWWTDVRNPIYEQVKDQMKWGILHKIVGVASVDVVQRKHPKAFDVEDSPVFVSAFDMV